jgi:hypothetical protein
MRDGFGAHPTTVSERSRKSCTAWYVPSSTHVSDQVAAEMKLKLTLHDIAVVHVGKSVLSYDQCAWLVMTEA